MIRGRVHVSIATQAAAIANDPSPMIRPVVRGDFRKRAITRSPNLNAALVRSQRAHYSASRPRKRPIEGAHAMQFEDPAGTLQQLSDRIIAIRDSL
jgi:hypothetical protein